jgi:hypothetical protein
MTKTKTKDSELLLDALIRVFGVERIIEAVGPKRIIEVVGVKRIIEVIGVKRIVEVLGPARIFEELGPARVIEGLKYLLRRFTPAQKRALKEYLFGPESPPASPKAASRVAAALRHAKARRERCRRNTVSSCRPAARTRNRRPPLSGPPTLPPVRER